MHTDTLRRLSLVGCFMSGLGGGSLYLYSAYAPQLAAHLNMLFVHTSLIGMVGNLGMCFSGPLAGAITDKHGISVPLAIGAFFTFIGYWIVRHCYIFQIASVTILSFALLLVGLGNSFTFASAMKCAALNFPENRGFATSIPLAGVGLSALFISASYRFLPLDSSASDDQEKLLSVLCFLPSFINIIMYPCIKVHTAPFTKPEIIELSDIDDSQWAHKRSTSMDVHGTTLIRNKLFWIFFVALGLMAGTGQMFIYSSGYIVRALVISSYGAENTNSVVTHYQNAQVRLISLTSFLGRLLSGVISDRIHRRGFSRSFLLLAAGSLLLIGQIAGKTISTPDYISFISCVTGLAYGLTYGSFPTIISDAFGMRHFSQNWGMLAMSPVPVSYVLNMLFGRIYDNHSTDGICSQGVACYNSLFDITTLGTVLSIVLVILVIRINKRV